MEDKQTLLAGLLGNFIKRKTEIDVSQIFFPGFDWTSYFLNSIFQRVNFFSSDEVQFLTFFYTEFFFLSYLRRLYLNHGYKYFLQVLALTFRPMIHSELSVYIRYDIKIKVNFFFFCIRMSTILSTMY